MMPIRSPASLRRASALRPTPATPFLYRTLLPEEAFFVIGRESVCASPPRLGLSRGIEILGLRIWADTVIGDTHLSNHQKIALTRQGQRKILCPVFCLVVRDNRRYPILFISLLESDGGFT
jgi:hypothetical protein